MILTDLRNIGKEMAKKLIDIDINTSAELKEIGSKEAFFRLKKVYPEVCLVHLYVIEGAITDTDYNMLSDETKADLKDFSDMFK